MVRISHSYGCINWSRGGVFPQGRKLDQYAVADIATAAGRANHWLVGASVAPEASGHGTEAVIRSIHEQNGRVRAAVIPVKLLATVVTLGVGGSAGKEGPAAQIGSGIASLQIHCDLPIKIAVNWRYAALAPALLVFWLAHCWQHLWH